MRDEIVAAAYDIFKVHPRDILGPYRYRFVAYARFAVFKVLHLRGWSYTEIGRKFNRDHTSVRSGVLRANWLIDHDEAYRDKVDTLYDAMLDAKPLNLALTTRV